jgi:glutaredoxin 3
MPQVLIYLTAACPFCQSAERLLAQKGVTDIERVRVDLEPGRRGEMMEKSGRRTVPQIWIGERHVGGCDDLYALEREGRLDPLLKDSVKGSP